MRLKTLALGLVMFASPALAEHTSVPSGGLSGVTCTALACTFTAPTLTIDSTTAHLKFSSDTGLARESAGVVKVTNGSSSLGTILVAAGSASSPSLTLSTVTRGWYYSSGGWYWSASPTTYLALGTSGYGVGSGLQFSFSSNADPSAAGADTGLARNAAGVIRATDGSTAIRGFLGGGAAVASATAMPVPTGRVFHVTGTTSITSITSTNFASGAVITLIFDDVLTFTDGNNLALAGNFVTTTGDTITLAYDGTNWYETGRSVN